MKEAEEQRDLWKNRRGRPACSLPPVLTPNVEMTGRVEFIGAAGLHLSCYAFFVLVCNSRKASTPAKASFTVGLSMSPSKPWP